MDLLGVSCREFWRFRGVVFWRRREAGLIAEKNEIHMAIGGIAPAVAVGVLAVVDDSKKCAAGNGLAV